MDLAKVIGASVVMGAAVAAGWWAWALNFPATTLADASALIVLIGAGVVIYAGLIWMLGIEGRDDLAAVMSKLRGKISPKANR